MWNQKYKANQIAKTVLSILQIKIIPGFYHLTWKILCDLIKTNLAVISLVCNIQKWNKEEETLWL